MTRLCAFLTRESRFLRLFNATVAHCVTRESACHKNTHSVSQTATLHTACTGRIQHVAYSDVANYGRDDCWSRTSTNVEVLALLPPISVVRIRSCVCREHSLSVVTRYVEVPRFIARKHPDLLIIDPALTEVRDPTEIATRTSALMRLAHVPTIIYCDTQPDVVSALPAIALAEQVFIVVRGSRNEEGQLHNAFLNVEQSDVAADLLAHFECNLQATTPGLRRAITDVLLRPYTCAKVSCISQQAQMSRRSFDRALERIGLPSARRLWNAARVARAHIVLRHSTASVAAEKLGYSSEKLLARSILRITGLSPRRLRCLTSRNLFDLLLPYLSRRGSGTSVRH